MILKVKKLDQSLPHPAYQSKGASGFDLYVSLKNQDWFFLHAGCICQLHTGLSVEIPVGYELQIRPRSGLTFNTALRVANSPGTIDADYRGEILVLIENKGSKPERIAHGQRIAQAVLVPIEQAKFIFVDELEPSDRGSNGFGSTGWG